MKADAEIWEKGKRNMRFVHIADVHLGAKPEEGKHLGIDREKEIYECFKHVIRFCNQEEVDLLLIAGDLFHRQPLLRELKEINYYFEQLTQTRVVMMAGNHDYISPRSNYIEFPWNENVYMFGSDEIDSIYFADIQTRVYGLSYFTRDIREAKYDEIKPQNEQEVSILLAHGGDERDIPIDKKKLVAAGFDYVALGHIHKHEFIAKNIAYAGSLEPLDKNELGDHGLIYGNMTKEHQEFAFYPFSKRKYKIITIQSDEKMTNAALKQSVLEQIHKKGINNLYRVMIEGRREEQIEFDTEALKKIGNVVEALDHSRINYDFKILKEENADNIIGLFIDRIQKENVEAVVREKALDIGLEALLHARE